MSDRQRIALNAFLSFVVPLVLVVYGYGRLTSRLDNIERKVEAYDEMRIEFAASKQANQALEKSVDRLTSQLDRVSQRLEATLRELKR